MDQLKLHFKVLDNVLIIDKDLDFSFEIKDFKQSVKFSKGLVIKQLIQTNFITKKTLIVDTEVFIIAKGKEQRDIIHEQKMVFKNLDYDIEVIQSPIGLIPIVDLYFEGSIGTRYCAHRSVIINPVKNQEYKGCDCCPLSCFVHAIGYPLTALGALFNCFSSLCAKGVQRTNLHVSNCVRFFSFKSENFVGLTPMIKKGQWNDYLKYY